MLKILLAVDGSETALRATRRLIDTVDWFKERPEVHLVTVHLTVPMAGRVSSVLGPDALARYYKEDEEAALKEARTLLKNAGLTTVEHTAVGQPAEEIVRLCTAHHCDMIYMGTHGRGAFGGLILGSTATKLLHLANVPVTLIR
ncbi:MAG: universal stress protein [Burkholderiales bacterium]